MFYPFFVVGTTLESYNEPIYRQTRKTSLTTFLERGFLHRIKIFSDKSLKKLVKSVASGNGAAEISLTNKGEYYWDVRSVDKAGNAGTMSEAWKFTLN